MDGASPAIQHVPLGYRHLQIFNDTMLNILIKKKKFYWLLAQFKIVFGGLEIFAQVQKTFGF